MRILINNEPVECEAYSFGFGDESHDLMDGIIIDMPGHYIFLSDHVEAHRDMQADLPDDIEHFDLTGCDPDFEQVPHKWVLESVGRMIVRTAEKVCIEACGE